MIAEVVHTSVDLPPLALALVAVHLVVLLLTLGPHASLCLAVMLVDLLLLGEMNPHGIGFLRHGFGLRSATRQDTRGSLGRYLGQPPTITNLHVNVGPEFIR